MKIVRVGKKIVVWFKEPVSFKLNRDSSFYEKKKEDYPYTVSIKKIIIKKRILPKISSGDINLEFYEFEFECYRPTEWYIEGDTGLRIGLSGMIKKAIGKLVDLTQIDISEKCLVFRTENMLDNKEMSDFYEEFIIREKQREFIGKLLDEHHSQEEQLTY